MSEHNGVDEVLSAAIETHAHAIAELVLALSQMLGLVDPNEYRKPVDQATINHARTVLERYAHAIVLD